MIETDSNGVLNIEYGHGCINSFIGHIDGVPCYSLTTSDIKKIGTLCKTDAKDDLEFGALVRFIFKKEKSLDILIDDLNNIKKNWNKIKGLK